MEFKELFDRHFFSNHHVEAKRLESRLEMMFAGCECVTYSSLSGLLVAAIDELCEDGIEVYLNQNGQHLMSLNVFLNTTGRKSLNDKGWNNSIQADVEAITKGIAPKLDLYICGSLVQGNKVVALFLDFAKCSDLLISAPVFVTRDPTFAEKVRWARSSYGRLAPTSVKIAANGRFSEFQGRLLNSFLDSRYG